MKHQVARYEILESRRLLVTAALAMVVGCSSTTQTTAASSQGGGGAQGGATSQSNGGSTGNDTAGSPSTVGGGGSADCTANAALYPDLHATCIEDLGQGKVRIRYDFGSADQGLDWSASTGAVVAVSQNALVVTSAQNDIGVAIFKKKLHVNKASYRVTLLSGSTTNWYVNTIWSGAWNPNAGYGGYHDQTGRGFIINGAEYAPADVSPVSVGGFYQVVLEQTDSALKWDQDGSSITETVGPVPVTDRSFALGAWESSAAFYDVVFEGTLN